MKRYLDERVRQDLQKKMVVLTGPRQVGKTTLSRQLVGELAGAQYLNYDVAAHRAVMLAQSSSSGRMHLIKLDTLVDFGVKIGGNCCREKFHTSL